MKEQHRTVVRLATIGTPRKDIASTTGLSLPNIDRILNKPESKQYRKSLENERESRSKLSPSNRVQRLLEHVIEAYEYKLDHATSADDIASLGEKISDLYKSMGRPPSTDDTRYIVVLPGDTSVEEWNRRTLENPSNPLGANNPIGPSVTPGGSKTPPPEREGKKDGVSGFSVPDIPEVGSKVSSGGLEMSEDGDESVEDLYDEIDNEIGRDW